MNEKKSLFDILPSAQIFLMGLIFAFFGMTSIGFFILLFKYVL